MLRKLIALIILVTGLAALGQPAQALVLEVDSVRASSASAYTCSSQMGVPSSQRSSASQRDEGQPKPCPKPPRIVLVVPTVMLQADRARE